jgi:hypothetical protein
MQCAELYWDSDHEAESHTRTEGHEEKGVGEATVLRA